MRICIVCNGKKDVAIRNLNGVSALVCKACFEDTFRIAEARRRALAVTG